MKTFLLLVLSIVSVSVFSQSSFYDLKAETIDGEVYNFKQLRGKKVLIVNTASKCGLTKQYEALEELNTKYQNNNFVIIGFPSNDFMKQEPGTNEEIKEFCSKNYGVTFQMMSKVSVKGKDKHPVYQWLTNKKLNDVKDSKVSWNFQKYLINEQGQLVDVFAPQTDPLSSELVEQLTKQLTDIEL